MNNLKSAPYKNNVMKESMEVFYDETFNQKLDSNPYVIGFKNGVYDLKANEFRDGKQEDYISMEMGVDYDKDMTSSDASVIEVYDFLEKVFPDKSIREYFLDTRELGIELIFDETGRRTGIPLRSDEDEFDWLFDELCTCGGWDDCGVYWWIFE